MSQVLISENILENIANAIINKGGATAPLTPAQMAKAIGSIPSGSSSGNMVIKDGLFVPVSDITAIDIPITFTPYMIAVWTTPVNPVNFTGFRMMFLVKDELAINAFDSVTNSAVPLYYMHESQVVGYNDTHVDREAYAVLNGNTLRVVSGNSYYLSKFKAGEEHKYLIIGTIE